MNSKLPTIFFGASAYVLPLIEFLHTNYDLALVVTTEKNPTDAVPKYCLENHIPYLSVAKLDDETIAKMTQIGAPLAVLADFKLLISQKVIDLFPKGIINIHPSLLPEYRGPTPGTTALLDGREETGVSLMLLDTQLDHGPLLGQVTEHISSSDTSATLYPRLFEKGTILLEKVLPQYLDGKIKPTEQDHGKATYTERLTRESGFIDANKPLDKTELNRMIRAYFPWPGVWTLLRLSASEGQAKKEIRVKLLPKNMLQIEGKRPVSYKDFMNGYPKGEAFLQKLGLL